MVRRHDTFLLRGGTRMLRETQPQITLWDAALPPELTQLSPELARVDKILDDDRFLAPYRRRFSKRIGRPTIPLDTFLRLMYLKFRYGLGYETLVREVSDSVMWRRFCRIPLNQLPPHPTTLIKLVKRCGPETLRELNELLVQKAREDKLIRGRKLRVDTTVVQANIRYPTDAGLLADGIKLVTRVVKRIQASGVAATVRFRNSTRAAKKRLLEISKVLRRRTGDARAEVDQVTAKMVLIGRRVARQAGKVLSQAKAELSQAGVQCAAGVERLVDRLERGVALLQRAVAQAKQVVAGNRHIADRLVSVFDPDARPIRRGRLKEPTEFGYKVALQEVENGIVSGYEVAEGNPPDEKLLPAAVRRHERQFGRPPKELAADRGFSNRRQERELQGRGVEHVCIPYRGNKSAARKVFERQAWFRRLARWRAGCEGRISLLKRKFGLDRCRSRGRAGAETWVGWAILAHNLSKMAALT